MEFPQNVYLCGVSEFSNRIEKKKERKEKDKTRRDKLAGFYFNLAQLAFTVLVLGSFATYFQNFEITSGVICMLCLGVVSVVGFALAGNYILK